MDSATGLRAAVRRPVRRQVLRIGVPAAYVIALATACVVRGIPTSRDALFLWVLLGLAALSATDLRGAWRGLLADWLPLAAVLFTYDILRGYADSLLEAHVLPQLRFDEIVFGGTVPTVWLQERLWEGADGIDWIDWAAWLVYLTHFFATLAVAAALWIFRRPLFRPYAAAVAVLAASGFATYALFPAVPPWMASEEGYLPETDRVVRFVSEAAPVDFFGAIWQQGAAYANDVAAMPSLHAAYAMLIALYFWPRVGAAWRVALAAYAVAMGLSLVYTAEHYVSDVLAGWLYAAGAFALVTWLVGRRARAGA
jgi:membrane-associated phospholipid phosphatase